jgi:tRNA-specific 2-thiouridylase
MKVRVLLAMSGGVDSSVAAYLLKRQGHEVIGVFMRTGVHDSDHGLETDRKQGCCSALDAGDARRVADDLDIPFYALDFADDFARIMDYFTDTYLGGRTPNPCIVCNNWLKFGKLSSYGRQLDADFIATGHYARVEPGVCGAELHRACDGSKDQSYVLFGLRRSHLAKIMFPLGQMHKAEVRSLARQVGLPVADKPDSVEICFIPNGDHASFIRGRKPEAQTAGHVRDRSGKVLAKHNGIEGFTVGQRKGLGFAASGKRYVLEIVPGSNDVVVGSAEELLSRGLRASLTNWLIDPPGSEPLPVQAKIRYRHPAAPGRAYCLEGGRIRVEFDTPQSAVTPGQAVVCYQGSRVLAGAWIDGALPLGN